MDARRVPREAGEGYEADFWGKILFFDTFFYNFWMPFWVPGGCRGSLRRPMRATSGE